MSAGADNSNTRYRPRRRGAYAQPLKLVRADVEDSGGRVDDNRIDTNRDSADAHGETLDADEDRALARETDERDKGPVAVDWDDDIGPAI